jgi:hypothetical protein
MIEDMGNNTYRIFDVPIYPVTIPAERIILRGLKLDEQVRLNIVAEGWPESSLQLVIWLDKANSPDESRTATYLLRAQLR